MRTLRLYVGELAAGLGLLGIAYIYLHIERDHGIVAAPYVKTVLVVAYVMVAGVAQSLTASELQAIGSRVLGLNLIVATVLSLLWWTGTVSVRLVALLVVATIAFRLFVAAVSIRVSRRRVRQLASALAGASLLLAGFGLAYVFGDDVYENYFLLPRTKEGFISPTRWQDFVFLFGSAVASIMLVFVAYRLLKYAFRAKSIPTTDSA
jgi:hypothetical protein